jgi:hypothetical protein
LFRRRGAYETAETIPLNVDSSRAEGELWGIVATL